MHLTFYLINVINSPDMRTEIAYSIEYTDPNVLILIETKIENKIRTAVFFPRGIMEKLGST